MTSSAVVRISSRFATPFAYEPLRAIPAWYGTAVANENRAMYGFGDSVLRPRKDSPDDNGVAPATRCRTSLRRTRRAHRVLRGGIRQRGPARADQGRPPAPRLDHPRQPRHLPDLGS